MDLMILQLVSVNLKSQRMACYVDQGVGGREKDQLCCRTMKAVRKMNNVSVLNNEQCKCFKQTVKYLKN